MRHLITTAAAGALALALAGCETMPQHHRSGTPPPVVVNPGASTASPLARSTSYTCEDLSTIVLTEGQADARATLNSGLELALVRTGVFGRYGAPPYEFTVAGGNGTFVHNGRVFRCRVK